MESKQTSHSLLMSASGLSFGRQQPVERKMDCTLHPSLVHSASPSMYPSTLHPTHEGIQSSLRPLHPMLYSELQDEFPSSPMSFKAAFPDSSHNQPLDPCVGAPNTGQLEDPVCDIKCCGKIFNDVQVLSTHYEACHLPTTSNLSGTIDSLFNQNDPEELPVVDSTNSTFFTPSVNDELDQLFESSNSDTAIQPTTLTQPLDIFPSKNKAFESNPSETNIDAELSLLLENSVGLEHQELDLNTKRRLSVAAFSIGSYVADMKRQRDAYKAQREKEQPKTWLPSSAARLPEDMIENVNIPNHGQSLGFINGIGTSPDVILGEKSLTGLHPQNLTVLNENPLLDTHVLAAFNPLNPLNMVPDPMTATQLDFQGIPTIDDMSSPLANPLSSPSANPHMQTSVLKNHSNTYALPSLLDNITPNQLLSTMNIHENLPDFGVSEALSHDLSLGTASNPSTAVVELKPSADPLTSPSMLSRHLAAAKTETKCHNDKRRVETPASSSRTDSLVSLKQFPCPHSDCEKRYKNRNGLKYHLAMVHGQKQASVPMYSLHLIHTGKQQPPPPQLIHTGEPIPFLCCVKSCDKRYRNLGGLKYHLLHAHSDIPFERTLHEIKQNRERQMQQSINPSVP